MDIHKPKPIHSWRELLTEIGVIVIGVAIALAGEQAVETLHDRAKAAEARASIRTEIAHNLNLIERRQATDVCLSKRLDEVSGLIAASAAGKLPQDALWIGMPVVVALDDGKYKTTTQSGGASLFDDREQSVYATIFTMFESYQKSSADEFQEWANLRTLETHPPASPTLDWQLRSALQMARTLRWKVNATRHVALQLAADIGVTPANEIQNIKMPTTCIPLHTPREEAMKLLFESGWKLEAP